MKMYKVPMVLRLGRRSRCVWGTSILPPGKPAQGEIISARAPPKTKEANQPAKGQNVECPLTAVIPKFTSTGPAIHGNIQM